MCYRGDVSKADERISRLTGRGRSDVRSGGLPLTDLFGPILQAILDDGPQTTAELTKAVQAGFIGRKETRLRYMYGIEDPWPSFMKDSFDQLASVDLLAADGDRWLHGPKFDVDTKLVAIRKSGPHPANTVTVRSKEWRAATGPADAVATEITSLAADLEAARNAAWAPPQSPAQLEALINSRIAGIAATTGVEESLVRQHLEMAERNSATKPAVTDNAWSRRPHHKAAVTCTHCGAEWPTPGWPVSASGHPCTTCSGTCRRAFAAAKMRDWRARHPSEPTVHPNICDQCQKEFTSRRSDARYCSTRCRVAAHRTAKL
jgi:hypothetical protein